MFWQQLKTAGFRLAPTLAAVACLAAFYAWYQQRGGRANRRAWEATYTERNLPVPPDGPREGYWGARLVRTQPDPEVGWRECAQQVAGLLAIDGEGMQHFQPAGEARFRVLILGGSVAFGSYASQIRTTYFHVLGRELERQGLAAEITVLAAAAWKSSQEVRALESLLPAEKPDLVILLDGLNDLANGATSQAWYRQEVPTLDGTPWTAAYHALDFQPRVDDYLANMQTAATLTTAADCSLLVVLQPSLAEKQHKTPLEGELLQNSLPPGASVQDYLDSYAGIRRGLTSLAVEADVSFLDASRIFGDDDRQCFTDLWHFSDSGHAALGTAMARRVAALLTAGRAAEPVLQ